MQKQSLGVTPILKERVEVEWCIPRIHTHPEKWLWFNFDCQQLFLPHLNCSKTKPFIVEVELCS